MAAHPSGTVTFLFTDIEGSTKLAQEHPDKWESLRERHHAILQSAMDTHNGYVFQIIGDAFCAAFHTTEDAIHAAIESQKNLHTENWGDVSIRVRMGINTGKAEIQKNGEYHGYLAMSRVSRLMAAAHGGQTLLSATTEQLTRESLPKEITLRDLGERRLKDMPQPEHIFQLIIPNLPADFPPLRTLETSPNNLPIQLTSFIGREKELADVKRLLTNTHLLTLIGPGGTGKTRLSLQAATDLLETFPHGVWLAELAPISDPSLVSSTVAAALNLPAEVHRPAIDMLCDYLRERELLIVLDNCEHLIGACARMADRLLRAAPKLRMIASSREALGIAGEVSYRVPSLELPDLQNHPSFESLSQYEAIKLFIDRATFAVSAFSATNENVSVIAQICHRLDGMPLAIELAAAKIRVLSVEQIAKRLDDRFRLLTGGSRTALERHQTLRATLDWSHNLLSPEEQILFRRLSIFVNGWMLEAVEAVCADESNSGEVRSEDILNLLEHLVHKSLVSAEEWQSEIRYRMLETMRQYAGEKLIEAGESEILRGHHLEYYLNLAETADPHLLKPEQIEWLNRLEAEHENMRAALEWSLGKERPEYVLRLASALGRFWSVRGYWLEGLKWLSSAFALRTKIETDEEKAAYVKARYWDADLAYRCDDLERARLSAELSLTLAQERANKMDVAIARFMVALVHYQSENNQIARPLAEQSLIEFQELHDPYWESVSYDIFGRILENLGELKPSQRILRKLELTRKAGERNNLADALFIASIWNYDNNRIDEARKCAEEADLLWKQIGAQINSSSMTFALIAWSNGDYELARSYYVDMRDRFGWQGEKHMRSGTIACLGKMAMEQGDLDQAQMYLEQALATVRELDYTSDKALRLAELGNLYHLKGDKDRFKQMAKESLLMKSLLSEYAKAILLITLLDFKAIQTQTISIQLLGAFNTFERNNERPLRIMHKAFLPDQAISCARESFGDSAFESAFAQGQKMSLDEALDLALKMVEEM